MKRIMYASAMVVVLCFGTVLVAQADNITIYDKNSSAETGWYGKSEDNEVEPGMIQKQIWDLEAFILADNSLSVIGGYDFENGVDGWDYGDIFIDIDGDAQFGDISGATGNRDVADTFGYEYVIDIDFTNFNYDVYALGAGTVTTTTVYEPLNQGSNPWRYKDGGAPLPGYQDQRFGYSLLTDINVGYGLTGGTHYMISGLSLAFLVPGTDFIVHTTMECGNDNLMGEGNAPVPEPATMLLFGTGLVGLAGVVRKRKQQK